MCSSGAFLNFGHSDPPIKMGSITLNDVPASGGLAAVDTYLGATEPSTTKGIEYGGAHVIEDLLRGRAVRLKATGPGTDCYPRTEIDTWVTLEELNQAYLFNPRNAYQNYAVAVNSGDQTLYTYWARCCRGWATRRTARRERSRRCSTIRRIGRSVWARGASSPALPATSRGRARSTTPTRTGTRTACRRLRQARLPSSPTSSRRSPEFFSAATFTQYGVSAFVGIGIPIPVLDEEIAETLALTDADLTATVFDYGVQRRSRPSLGTGDLRAAA